MGRIVGLACAAFSVTLLAWAVLGSRGGGASSLTPVGLSLALLLVAVLTLRPRDTRV